MVAAVAMTDGFPSDVRDGRLCQWALEHCINWVQSDKELDTRLPDAAITQVRSAATRDHPLTTHKAFECIWRFFADAMEPEEPGSAPPVEINGEPEEGGEQGEHTGRQES
jgi:hypothetical protein